MATPERKALEEIPEVPLLHRDRPDKQVLQGVTQERKAQRQEQTPTELILQEEIPERKVHRQEQTPTELILQEEIQEQKVQRQDQILTEDILQEGIRERKVQRQDQTLTEDMLQEGIPKRKVQRQDQALTKDIVQEEIPEQKVQRLETVMKMLPLEAIQEQKLHLDQHQLRERATEVKMLLREETENRLRLLVVTVPNEMRLQEKWGNQEVPDEDNLIRKINLKSTEKYSVLF